MEMKAWLRSTALSRPLSFLEVPQFVFVLRGGGGVFWLVVVFVFVFLETTVLSCFDFSHGKLGLLSPAKAGCDRVTTHNELYVLGVLSVSIIHQTLIWTTGSFNVHTDGNACDCTQRCMDIERESALKVEENPLPHRGIKPASAACRSDAVLTELHTFTPANR